MSPAEEVFASFEQRAIAEEEFAREHLLLTSHGWTLREGTSNTWTHPTVTYRCNRDHALMRIRIASADVPNSPTAATEIAAESDESYEASEGLYAARQNLATEEVRS